ncbi:hypothetical protein FA15DRAFT_662569 [Coprinopsis marcescibilis]|uniref:Uncharacterized protein n=1 Tax=Coprinopsis marcescibilis TaxID=230819 RepID=A0A5C3LCU2_COPMA|nr:hypothetical protein FA15DRAFT_662569 [Coprinopsis marcescibilis]
MLQESTNGFSEIHKASANLNGLPPPPPYTEDDPRKLISRETTTSQVVTTTTTTTTTTRQTKTLVHSASAVFNHSKRLEANESAGPSRFLVVDKALPPIPRSGSLSFDLPTRPATSSAAFQPSFSRSVSSLTRPTLDAEIFKAVFPASVSGPNVANTRQDRKPMGEKEAPWADGLQAFPSFEQDKESNTLKDGFRRRSRGISFGALSFLSMTTADVKGKGKESGKDRNILESPRSAQNSPKVLSRKPSFWSKPKATTPLDTAPPLPKPAATQQPPQLPPLPDLSSLSAFGLDETPRLATEVKLKHPTLRTSRRHSTDSLSVHISSQPIPTRKPYAFNHLRPQASHPSLLLHPTQQSSSLDQTFSPPQNGPSLADLPRRQRAQTNPGTTLQSPNTMSSTSREPKSAAVPHFKPNPTKIPRPFSDSESPDAYLARVRTVVGKGELASILASSAEQVYVEALQTYLREFNFHNDPLDIALRKLLMEVGLPRETQQIDRVIQAFSDRYLECNTGLFSEEDNAYIIAFSLIMLHTDAFNKSNRTKMNKADYIKNTTIPGVYPEVLGCFYDNIVFSPFIFIEDPLDFAHAGISPDAPRRRTPSNQPAAGILAKSKIDPYYLITNDLLESMRAEMDKIISVEDPFSFEGVLNNWDNQALQEAFSNARLLQIEIPSTRSFFHIGITSEPTSGPLGENSELPPSPLSPSAMTLKVTKVGLLNRKDDITGRGKRAAVRKWRQWSVLLTGSQLLFFRDTSMVDKLVDWFGSCTDEGSTFGEPFKPDEVLSVKDAIAVFDKSYTKHDNTFRFILADGRQILFQATDINDMNDWLSKINYATAFKSAGVKMRPTVMSNLDVRLTGVAAATSHLHDLQVNTAPIGSPSSWDSRAPRELMGMLRGTALDERPKLKHRLTILQSDSLDLDTLSTLQTAKTDQFETTFNQVKDNLAQADSPWMCESPIAAVDLPLSPLQSNLTERTLSRTDIIKQKVQELKKRQQEVQSQLDSETRFLRNVAILRPLQKATRNKLLSAVQAFVGSRRLTPLRIDSQRLACHIFVLIEDLEAEAKSLGAMKNEALNVAKQALEHRRHLAIPRMTISVPESDGFAEVVTPSHRVSRSWSNSSVAESFHSALDFGSEWLPDDGDNTSTSISHTPSPFLDSPRPSTSSSPSGVIQMGYRNGTHEQFSFSSLTGATHKEFVPQITAFGKEEEPEEAEPWNKTRAAKRVSLIRVPSSVTFTAPKRVPSHN